MLYLTSRLQTTVSFDPFNDPDLWENLVPDVKQISQYVWKIWMISNVFRFDNVQSSAYSLEDGEWQRKQIITQTSSCYLRIENYDGRTTFTIISASQKAFLKLVALIENLYDPVTPISLNGFLLENFSLPVRSVELLERETNEETFRTFAQPIHLGTLRAKYSMSNDFINLSVIPNFDSPLKVSQLYFKMQEDQAWFFISPEEQSLPSNELIQLNKLFELTDKVFKINSYI